MAQDGTGPVARGFARAEFEARAARAQALMHEAELDGLLVTIEANFRYLSGFDCQFWVSPTRPWFLVLPREGAPLAIVPELGAAGMAATWVEEVRTWPAPRPADDGVSLVTQALGELPRRFGRVGAELGAETSLRMPTADFLRLREALGPLEVGDGSAVLRALRMVKSATEVERIRHICAIVGDGFAALPGKIAAGDTEREACRKLRIDLLERGADGSPYMIGVSGQSGYDNIVMGPTDRVLGAGDVLIIDTGSTYDGYFSDFDRNFAFGPPSDEARRAHDAVWRATEAGIAAARPGARLSDMFRAMMAVLEAEGAPGIKSGGAGGNQVGRMGHGLGLQMTEPPSVKADDDTEIVPGMVLTVEPGLEWAPGKMMVHEENLVVTEGAPDLLTRRAPPEMPVVG